MVDEGIDLPHAWLLHRQAWAEPSLSTKLSPIPTGWSSNRIPRKAFDVPDSYADSIRSRAVPESNAKGSPVFQVDTTKTDSSYGLRPIEFPALEGAAIPGSGRVIAP